MRFCFLCRGLFSAVLIVLIPHVRSQDASIDQLLEKLPPPEKFAPPSVEGALEQTDPAVKDPLAGEMILAFQARNFSRAADLSHQLLVRYPQSAGAHFMNGATAANLEQFGEASFSLRKAINLQPNLAIAH